MTQRLEQTNSRLPTFERFNQIGSFCTFSINKLRNLEKYHTTRCNGLMNRMRTAVASRLAGQTDEAMLLEVARAVHVRAVQIQAVQIQAVQLLKRPTRDQRPRRLHITLRRIGCSSDHRWSRSSPASASPFGTCRAGSSGTGARRYPSSPRTSS